MMRGTVMRKILYIFFILFCISSVAFSADTSTLTLVIGDALTIGFSSDASGNTVLNSSTNKLTGIKTTTWDSSSGEIDTTNINSKNDQSYATAYLEFYVFWNAFVSKSFSISLTVPDNFVSTGTTTAEQLDIVSDSGKMPSISTGTIALEKGLNEVATKVSGLATGSQKCIIAVDITKAKPNTKYTATLTLTVKAAE